MDTLQLNIFISVFYKIYLRLAVQRIEPIRDQIESLRLTASIFPDFSVHTILRALTTVFGRSLEYQSHTITRLTGIKKVKDMKKLIVLTPWQRLAYKANLTFMLSYFKIFRTYKLVLFAWSRIGSGFTTLFHISSITYNKRITV